MSSTAQKKIIYTDNGRDVALTGSIQAEDDFFFTVLSQGREYKIGKKAVVAVKEVFQ